MIRPIPELTEHTVHSVGKFEVVQHLPVMRDAFLSWQK
ncbi:hypothetical protein EH11_02354 [Bacillus subtilis]|nr:hypothetical protein EH11_02354 [Bacillus subtilis]RUS09233.1 hypothetical protein EFW59_02362 [Bacillus subtilis]